MATRIKLTGKTRHRIHIEKSWFRGAKTYLVLQVEYHESGTREHFSPDHSHPMMHETDVDGYFWRDSKVEDLNELQNCGCTPRQN